MKAFWRCRLCKGTAELTIIANSRQTLSYANPDGSVRSWAHFEVGSYGTEHTCPPGTLAVESKETA